MTLTGWFHSRCSVDVYAVAVAAASQGGLLEWALVGALRSNSIHTYCNVQLTDRPQQNWAVVFWLMRERAPDGKALRPAQGPGYLVKSLALDEILRCVLFTGEGATIPF